uniref:Anthocyanidin 5,3-O-glucosyltransferase n=1 Tax=Anthurium amnicola TaxID=1678845 RepID=A0A1D1XL26_9ARAE
MAEARGSERTIVLYPSPGMGHLVSMVELAKVFLSRGFSVRVVIVDPPYNTGSTAAFVSRVSAAHPSISFHRLPQVSLSHVHTTNHEALAMELVRLSNPDLLPHLQSTSPLALVLDVFCLFTLDVARELRLPAYLFYTSGASCLAAFLHFPSLHDTTTRSFKDMGDSPIDFPGIPKIPANHVPVPVLDRGEVAYHGFLHISRCLTQPEGTIINTFEELEPEAVEAIRGGLCVPQGTRTPPIYCIGPLITSEDRESMDGRRAECLEWLDSQPRASVVFLCFGSLGRFSAHQLKEIATGLEKSGQRFLWVVRSPPSDDPSRRFEKPPEPDLDSLLSEGFLERTGERGMVVKSWAPQASVLAHESVGGFVTHLGWNSVLEAICAGVPMVGWPLYAEQRMNKVFLVDGLDLAGVMEGYDKDLVAAAEVEARIRWLMESEGGQGLRARTSAAKATAVAALGAGGSSGNALDALVESLTQG